MLSGIASKILTIGPNCAGMSFERLSFEMSKDSLSKDNPAQVGLKPGIAREGQNNKVETVRSGCLAESWPETSSNGFGSP